MSKQLVSSSRTVILPLVARDGFNELIMPAYSKNVTLSNRIYVDFTRGTRGGWTIEFDTITADEWQELRDIFDDQFTNREMLDYSDDELGISNVKVFLSLPSERSIKWDNQAAQDITIVLERRDAVS
jgi:hypothetical protein